VKWNCSTEFYASQKVLKVNNTYLVKNKNFTVISLDQFFVHQVQYTTRRCNDHVYCTPFIHCVFISTSRSTVHTIHSLCLHLNITVNSAHHSFTVSSSQHHGQQCTPFIHCVFISTSRSTVLCLHWSRLHCASYIDKTVCQPSSNTHGNSVIWFLVIPGATYVPVAIKYRQS